MANAFLIEHFDKTHEFLTEQITKAVQNASKHFNNCSEDFPQEVQDLLCLAAASSNRYSATQESLYSELFIVMSNASWSQLDKDCFGYVNPVVVGTQKSDGTHSFGIR